MFPLPFITATQFLVRYDYRWVAKNVLDTGQAALQTDLTNPLSTAGAVLNTFLIEASELVLAAATIGARYSQTDLTVYGGQLLVRIVSDLTMGLILKRRARATTDEQALSQPYAEALAYLEALRRGERVFFNVPEVVPAGVGEPSTMFPRPPDPPMIIQEAPRFFGTLGNKYPVYPGFPPNV